MAEILTRYSKKEEISILTYYNSLSSEKKKSNWKRISIFLKTKDYDLPINVYEPILYHAPDIAKEFLLHLYEHLTKRKLPKHPSKSIMENPKKISHFTLPTATTLIHDRELTRIINVKEKTIKTLEVLENHNQQLRMERQDPGFLTFNKALLNFMIDKKRRVEEESMKKQRDEEMKQKAILERAVFLLINSARSLRDPSEELQQQHQQEDRASLHRRPGSLRNPQPRLQIGPRSGSDKARS